MSNIDSLVARYTNQGTDYTRAGVVGENPGLKTKLGELASTLASVQNEVIPWRIT